MKIERTYQAQTGIHKYIIELEDAELASVNLSNFDRALIRECETAQDRTLADKVLALETIVRRVEESNKNTAEVIPN